MLVAFVPAEGESAQRLSGIQKGFKAAEFFGPPHDMQMQSLLQAEQVQPYSDKLFLLIGLTLQTYRETGEPELLIKAPRCLYDRETKSATSPGALRVTTADGKFSIEGEGFSLQQTNSSLVISNRVWTVIDPELLNPVDAKSVPATTQRPRAPVEIRAERFAYSGESGVGLYQGKVRATSSNEMSMASEKLFFELPFKERQLKTLTAEQDVVIDRASLHATAQKALYSSAIGLIRLQGAPAWTNELSQGRGDELIIDQTNKVFRAEGNAWVQLPAQGLSVLSLLSASNEVSSASTRTTNHFVEVSSDYHEFRTNHAVFGDRVKLTERVESEPRGTLSCRHMDVSYIGSNQLQQLVAEKDVAISDGTNLLSGGRAVFDGTNGVLVLTENPAWVSGSRSGTGDLIQVDTRTNEMLVRGQARMRLPANELARAAGTLGGTNTSPATTATTNQWAEVVCQEYRLRPGGARFTGGVQATHPRMKWACESMEVALPQAGGQVESMLADKNVAFELTDEKGQKLHGRGATAVYHYSVTPTATNDLVQLTGTPAMLETAQGTNRNKIIILDRAKQQIITPGDFRIDLPVKEAGTNALVLPNIKLRK